MIITITQAQIDHMANLRSPNYRKDLETILIRQANSKIQIDTNTKAYNKLQRKYQNTRRSPSAIEHLNSTTPNKAHHINTATPSNKTNHNNRQNVQPQPPVQPRCPNAPRQTRPENETKHCRNNSTNPDNWCENYTGNHCELKFPKGKCLCGWQKWLTQGPCPIGKF